MNPEPTGPVPFAPVPMWPPTLQPMSAGDYPTAPTIPADVHARMREILAGRMFGPLNSPFENIKDEVLSYQPEQK